MLFDIKNRGGAVNILVAVDLSGSTKTVIDHMLDLAVPLSASVWLLHVADPEPDFVGYDVGPQSERDAMAEKHHREHAELQVIAEGMRNTGLQTTALLVQGPTAETILREAAKLEVDMIIVGSHGHGAVSQVLVGSVSEGVLRNCVVPVLVVPVRDNT
jgi:nucleotide-binding universal stress UspA family protein